MNEKMAKIITESIERHHLNTLEDRVTLFWKDRDGYYLDCNDLQVTHYGWERDYFVGHNDFDIGLSPETSNVFYDDLQVICQGKVLVSPEFWVIDNDVNAETIRDNAIGFKKPLRDSDGNIIGLAGCGVFPRKYRRDQQEQFHRDLFTVAAAMSIDLSSEFLHVFHHERQQYLLQSLTPKERDVLRELLAHQSAKQIAACLHLSPRTVEFHVHNIKRKLGCRKVSELLSKIQSA